MEDTIEVESKAKAEYCEKIKILEVVEILEKIQKQAEEFKIELNNVMNECEKLKIKVITTNKIVQVFYKIYENHLELKISDIKNLSLYFDLSNPNQKKLMIELESAKLRLHSIKRIKIDKVTASDSDLNSFLQNCAPEQLEMFCINRNIVSNNEMKADFYLDALCKTIKTVTKENPKTLKKRKCELPVVLNKRRKHLNSFYNLITLKCSLRFYSCRILNILTLIEFLRGVIYLLILIFYLYDTSAFEQVVKSASNSERLIMRFCEISCSSALNFSISSNYNINFLSFTNCGNSSRNSDFKTNPSLFENIVEAISKSGLKDSLQTLDIQSCGLDKEKVKELIIEHEMNNVSIIENGPEPM